MAFQITPKALNASLGTTLNPQIVFSIDGLAKKFGAVEILKVIRIGDDGLFIDNLNGDPWYIGGLGPLENQSDYISLDTGTSTVITQQLQPDKGLGSSISNMSISLIDKNEEVSRLISPGFDLSEILGRSAKVQLGFQNTGYPEDYVTVFRGYIEDIQSGPGLITFNLTSTEQKKRQVIFSRVNMKLTSSISSGGSVATISVDDTTDLQTPVLGPDGIQDTMISYYVKIGEEIFKYTGKTSTTITGCTRAQLGTVAASHDIDDSVDSLTRLTGNSIRMAQKIMQSGWNGNFVTGVDVSHFNYITAIDVVANSIFFFGVDVKDEYGLEIGDYITTTGATNGANNVTLKQITAIEKTNDGSYVVVGGVTFVNEADTSATISFRSQWDSLGQGMKMKPSEVDNAEHERIYRLFLSSFEYDFILSDGGDGKEFIDSEIYKPYACFSIPRKGRASLGFHIGPIPGTGIQKLDQTNVENADKIKVRRSLSRNFYNQVRHDFDVDVLTGEFLTSKISDDATSKADIPVGDKQFTINSLGIRSALNGVNRANQAASRLLNRYKRGAEYFDGVEISFGIGYPVEIGDVVLFDTQQLKVTDITEGNRSGNIRLFEVMNKSLNIKTGKISLNLVDTNFSTSNRYCLISTVSKIKSASSTSQFVIKSSYSSIYGDNEYLKWTRYGQIFVRVRSPNGTTRNDVAQVDTIIGNTVVLQTPLSFTPQVDDLMEFSHYNDATEEQKLVYGFMRDTGPFDDGKDLYKMI